MIPLFFFMTLAPFVFTDYLFLVITMSQIVFVCGWYQTFFLALWKIVLCIAGENNMIASEPMFPHENHVYIPGDFGLGHIKH